MRFQFDPDLPFQRAAINAVLDLFAGQPEGSPDYSVIRTDTLEGLLSGQERTDLGVGNQLLLDTEKLRENLRDVQTRNDIEVADPSQPLEGWAIFDEPAKAVRSCPHFSVEMETGTGKTYVYLRTIFELSQRYGFRKFVIVVPSVAIREGVLKSIEMMTSHFGTLYNGLPFEHSVYNAKKVNELRHFAASTTLQILVINIDAFRKNFIGTEAEQKSNVIYRESDKLAGHPPIEFVQAARPIVIIDEPQSVDSTDKSQEAIKALNPLCTLRYSATHRNSYNLVYRLDPIRAFEERLVKQIVVAGAAVEDSANYAFVRVIGIENEKGIKAKLRIHVQTNDGPRERTVTVKQNKDQDLFTLSKERECYRNGFQVAEISVEPGNEHIRFTGGRTLRIGEEIGGMRDDLWRVQIRHTVRKHLDKELQMRERGIKVLSLFFIDRVAHYKSFDADGHPLKGKFAHVLENALVEFAQDERYRSIPWLRIPVEELHGGYFAEDRKGVFKDTRGESQADDDAYNKIMREKEQLLSFDEPLRFIFSHSALREGWDNPNVFQICTLNETKSAMKKRQEIGRGLRLPVDQTGQRVLDESINKLHIIANESYEDFARSLQTEYEEDCGVTFGKVPLAAVAKLTRVINDTEVPLDREAANEIFSALVQQEMIDGEGRILPGFDPTRDAFRLELPDAYRDVEPAVIDLLSSYRLERHIRRDRQDGVNKLKKEVMLSPDFKDLWERIKPRTTYRVEFETDTLVTKAVNAIQRMPKIEAPKVRVTTGQVRPTKAGVGTTLVAASEELVASHVPNVPDVLGYLQRETELTRSTLVRILKESERLSEVFVNPQRFMDQVTGIIKHELHRLLVDGIKYERVPAMAPDAEWEMLLFRSEELIDYLSAVQVDRSIYEYVVYDSDVERIFAKRLNDREDIRLFVKLPRWFAVETPVGRYNPDWAIVKDDTSTLYLVRETKSTKNFLKLRTTEADKARCGAKHFEALGVPFAVAVTADEV